MESAITYILIGLAFAAILVIGLRRQTKRK
jgi:hypothetical protein